ncbi:MAG: YceH family protein [Verrucomicrobiota bacterium]
MSDEPPEDSESVGSDEPLLTFNESRILGCLLEKEVTTPDQYPLTFNSLHSACNQSSNREPVTDLGTDEVEEAMEGLRYKKLSLLVHQAGARVPKCKHTLENKFPYLTSGQRALLCVLLLRGQQTAGELRQRTERMHPFVDVERAVEVLNELIENTPNPLVRILPAGGGRRVATYVHLLCGEPKEGEAGEHGAAVPSVSSTPVAGWREEMESEIEELRSEIVSLRAELEELKTNLGI